MKDQRLLTEAFRAIKTLVDNLYQFYQGLEEAKRVNNELIMDIK